MIITVSVSASASVRIAKYTPLRRLRKIRYDNGNDTSAGKTRMAASATVRLWNGSHHSGSCSTLLQTMKSGSSGAEASSFRNIASA